MKKLILFAGAILLASLSSCNWDNKTQEKADTSKNTKGKRHVKSLLNPIKNPIYATLNNIAKDDARRMIFNFQVDGIKTAKTQRTWYHIGGKLVNAIYTILNKELNEERAQGVTDGLIDGIRIYFINDPKKPGFPSLTFVATRDSSYWYCKSDYTTQHRDTYLHDRTDALFNFSDMNDYAVECQHNNDGGGAALYTPTGEVSCNVSSYDVPRSDAEKMVANFEYPANQSFNTYSVWYPLELFSTLNQSAFKGGLRFYMASTIAKEVGRHTFLIMPTGAGSGTQEYVDDFSCNKVPFHQKDNGELCPHHCN